MMIGIGPEVRRAIEESGAEPPRLLDPLTNSEYVLLRADVYDRLRAILDVEDPTAEELATHMWNVMKDEWEDPAMDAYDEMPERP